MNKVLWSVVGAVLALTVFGRYDGEIALDKADGIYRSGETAKCRVLLRKDGKALSGAKARLILKWEGKIIDRKVFDTTGEPLEFTYCSEKPGWIYFGFEILDDKGNPLRGKEVQVHPRKPTIASEIGALFDPDKFVSPVREPADFDEFWAKRRAEVEAVDRPAALVELKSGIPGIKLFSVTIPCPRGVTATGYLAYPEKAAPKSLPGYIFFQSLTYSDVSRVSAINQAKKGALAFAATWHGFPCGKTKQFYDKELRSYLQGGQRNLGDREKWVYSDMFFRVMSELRFLRSRPEWDGKTLVVYGGSLGGIQSAFAAAIEPAATTAVVSVPSFCECNAYEAGRTPYGIFRRMGEKKLKAEPKYIEMGFYYDIINFAKRIKCETFVCTGFVDESCYPSNVYVFYNTIPATTRKTLTTNPRTGHFNTTKNVKGDSRVGEIFRATVISALPR